MTTCSEATPVCELIRRLVSLALLVRLLTLRGPCGCTGSVRGEGLRFLSDEVSLSSCLTTWCTRMKPRTEEVAVIPALSPATAGGQCFPLSMKKAHDVSIYTAF